jgi:integration host factor subunit beta
VDAFLNAVKDAWPSTRTSRSEGFGTFKVRERKSRLARNPRTGDPVEVPPRAVPVFKPSKDLRALVEEKPLAV